MESVTELEHFERRMVGFAVDLQQATISELAKVEGTLGGVLGAGKLTAIRHFRMYICFQIECSFRIAVALYPPSTRPTVGGLRLGANTARWYPTDDATNIRMVSSEVSSITDVAFDGEEGASLTSLRPLLPPLRCNDTSPNPRPDAPDALFDDDSDAAGLSVAEPVSESAGKAVAGM